MPSTRIRIALRAALRRRYSFAAVRVLRRGVAAAFAAHRARQLGELAYDGEREHAALVATFRRSLVRLRKRWPRLDLGDPRSAP